MFKKGKYLVVAVVLVCFTLVTQAFAETVNYPYTTTFSSDYYNNDAASLTWSKDTTSTLLVSNNPEYPTTAGILCRDTGINSTGKFRVYWAHNNTTSTSSYIGVVIHNTSASSIKLYIARHGHSESTSSFNSYKMGQAVLYNYLISSETETLYATIASGSYAYVGFSIAAQQFGSGMYDFVVRNSSGSLVTGGIKAQVYMTKSSTGSPSNVINNTPLANDGLNCRARFTFATKSLTWSPSSLTRQLTFVSTHTNSWPLPTNDLSVGYDETDNLSSGINATNYGGYGELSKITINYTGSGSYGLVLAPQWEQIQYGQYLAVYVYGTGTIKNSSAINSTYGWVIKSGATGSSTIYTSLPGYDFAPLHLGIVS